MKMNIRKKFSSQLMMVKILLAFTVFTLISGFAIQFSKIKQYNNEIAALNEQIEDTKLEIEELKEMEHNKLSGDLESIARNRLNMIKKNEIVYIDTNREGN